MGPIPLFLYNLFLIIAYTAVIAFAFDQFITIKEKYLRPLIVLFLFYLLDTVIICLTNEFTGFAEWYNQTFMSVPTIKTIIYLVTAFCLLQVWNRLVNRGFPAYQGIVLILLGLWYLFIPMMENSPIKVWLYYVAYQIFTLSFSLLALKRLERVSLSEKARKTLKILLILTALFSFFIVAEDSIVIFNVDIYSGNRIYIQDRNYSEDILRICYTVIILQTISTRRFGNAVNSLLNASESQEQPESAADTATPVLSEGETEETKKFNYAQSIHLTGREGEILNLLLDDQNNQQISETLFISIGTVKTHVHNIFQKAGVAHRDELIREYKKFSDGSLIHTV